MSGLIRLVYASRANFKSSPALQGIEPTVARILMQSRKNNPRQKIGGVLYYGNGYFFQCLEGESDAVNRLISKLRQDERHRDLEIVKLSQVRQRLFSNWSMKYIALESDVRDLLARFGVKQFDPYQFSDEVIDGMVALFSKISGNGQPDQNYIDQPKPVGIWQKIKSLFG